jgi:hypothetical protein
MYPYATMKYISPVVYILFNYVKVYLINLHTYGTKVTQENTRATYINKNQQRQLISYISCIFVQTQKHERQRDKLIEPQSYSWAQ